MFCIYAMYDRKQIDKLINAYFTEGCPKEIRIKMGIQSFLGSLLFRVFR